MRGTLLVAERPAHRRGTQTFPARAFIHKTFGDVQFIDVERRSSVFRFALCIGNRAAQDFFNVLGGTLLRVAQGMQGVLSFLPTNQIHYQPRLLRRHTHMLRQRVRFDVGLSILQFGHVLCSRRRWRCAASCWCRSGSALKRRLHAMSLERARRRKLAKLMPDHLFGDIHGNKFLSVMHGDGMPNHVWHDGGAPRPRLDDFFSLRVLRPSTLSRRWPSTNGPFFNERPIDSLLLHSTQAAPLCPPHFLESPHRPRNAM